MRKRVAGAAALSAVLAAVVIVMAAQGQFYSSDNTSEMLAYVSLTKSVPRESRHFELYTHPRLEILTFQTEESNFLSWAKLKGLTLIELAPDRPAVFREANDLKVFEIILDGWRASDGEIVAVYDRSCRRVSVYYE